MVSGLLHHYHSLQSTWHIWGEFSYTLSYALNAADSIRLNKVGN